MEAKENSDMYHQQTMFREIYWKPENQFSFLKDLHLCECVRECVLQVMSIYAHYHPKTPVK